MHLTNDQLDILRPYLVKYQELNEKYTDTLFIGGSIALILYGLIPFRTVKDIDIITTKDLFPSPDLSKKSFNGLEYTYFKRFGKSWLYINNQIREVESEEYAINYIRNKSFRMSSDLPDPIGSNSSNFTEHDLVKNITVDYLVGDVGEYSSFKFEDNTYLLTGYRSIINARLMYGLKHKHLMETIEIIPKLRDFRLPKYLELEFPF